jgi:hypothetical protein
MSGVSGRNELALAFEFESSCFSLHCSNSE